MGRGDGHHHNQHHHQHHKSSSNYSRGSSSGSSGAGGGGGSNHKHHHKSSRHQNRNSSSSSSSNSYSSHSRTSSSDNHHHPFADNQQQYIHLHHQQQQQHLHQQNIPGSHQFTPFDSSPFPPAPMLQDFNQPIFHPQPVANLQQMCFLQPQQQNLSTMDIPQHVAQHQNFPQLNLHSNIVPQLINNHNTPHSTYSNNLELSSNASSTNTLHSAEQHLPINPLDRLQLPANQITETGIIPNISYYELPAGLIVPLVKPNQRVYQPVNPKDLRLPLPKFPDENFLKSIDSYYASSDGIKRDNDGWDREFLDAWIKNKEDSTT